MGKQVFTLRYQREGQQGVLKYSFVSGASFQQALQSGLDKIHRQHASEKLEIRSFLAEPGDEVPDEVATDER